MDRKPARYYGMTMAQLGILSCLAVLACGATSTVLWLVAAPGLTLKTRSGIRAPGTCQPPPRRHRELKSG